MRIIIKIFKNFLTQFKQKLRKTIIRIKQRNIRMIKEVVGSHNLFGMRSIEHNKGTNRQTSRKNKLVTKADKANQK